MARGGAAGVTCWTCTGGAGESDSEGGAEKPGAEMAGTGVDGSGVSVGVGVLPRIVELTISRVGLIVGAGVGVGDVAPNTPVASSSARPRTTAPPAISPGTTSFCQVGGGLRSVTRQARGLEERRFTGARVGTSQRYRAAG